MPSWSQKDERLYEHVKEGYEERGVPAERAEETAARTVNKSRRISGSGRSASPDRRTASGRTLLALLPLALLVPHLRE